MSRQHQHRAQRSMDAARTLAEANLGLAYHIAIQFAQRNQTQHNQYLGAAYCGLLRACLVYDTSLPYTLSTLAAHYIKGAIADDMRVRSSVRRRATRWARDAERAETCLMQQLGRMPQRAEVAALVGMSEAVFAENARLHHEQDVMPLSHVPIAASLYADPNADTSAEAEAHELRDALCAAIERCLRPREARCVRAYYFEHRRMHEIARSERTTESYISQVLTQARVKLARERTLQSLRAA